MAWMDVRERNCKTPNSALPPFLGGALAAYIRRHYAPIHLPEVDFAPPKSFGNAFTAPLNPAARHRVYGKRREFRQQSA